MIPGNATPRQVSGRSTRRRCAIRRSKHREWEGSAKCWHAMKTRLRIDPNVKDSWGIPVLRFNYKFGENEKKMCEDMAKTAREMFEAANSRFFRFRKSSPEGWSIHELGTSRMGNDPKTSVVNQFQQCHDVKNLLVVDGSTHVNASCQNPTWTIMALCWRSCDNLADQLKKGEI